MTGASSGPGRELSRLLYSKNAKVHVAGRSEQRANEAIQSIKTAVSESSGSLVFLSLDLDDLASIKSISREIPSRRAATRCPFQQCWLPGPRWSSCQKSSWLRKTSPRQLPWALSAFEATCPGPCRNGPKPGNATQYGSRRVSFLLRGRDVQREEHGL